MLNFQVLFRFFINGCIVYCWQGAPGPTGEPGEEGPAGEQVIRTKQNERQREQVCEIAQIQTSKLIG